MLYRIRYCAVLCVEQLPAQKTLECKNEFIKVVNVNSVNIYSVIKHTYIDDTCMCVHVCVPKLMM